MKYLFLSLESTIFFSILLITIYFPNYPDAQTLENFRAKLKRLRNQPRPDRIFVNFQGFTIAIALATSVETPNNEVSLLVAVYNQLTKSSWTGSAEPFTDSTQLHQASMLLNEIVNQ